MYVKFLKTQLELITNTDLLKHCFWSLYWVTPRRPWKERPEQVVFTWPETSCCQDSGQGLPRGSFWLGHHGHFSSQGGWAQLCWVVEGHPRFARKYLSPSPHSGTHSLWGLGKTLFLLYKEGSLMHLATSEEKNLRESLREFLKYCLGERRRDSENWNTPLQLSFFQGGGPICSVYTPGPGVKGGLEEVAPWPFVESFLLPSSTLQAGLQRNTRSQVYYLSSLSNAWSLSYNKRGRNDPSLHCGSPMILPSAPHRKGFLLTVSMRSD